MRESVPSGNQTRRAPARADSTAALASATPPAGSDLRTKMVPSRRKKGTSDNLAREFLLCDERNLARARRRHDHPIKITRMIDHDDRIGLG